MEKRSRGRPRTFDRAQALDAAMLLFWERGYEDTSVSDLAGAMGVRSASLYAAFGDKHRLFAEAVERYQAAHGGYVGKALALSPTRKAIEALLTHAAERFSDPKLPSGCMVVLAATRCGQGSTETVGYLNEQRNGLIAAVRARLERGLEAGDMPVEPDLDELAAYIVLIFEALAVGARRGFGRMKLIRHAQRALCFWPTIRT